MVDYFEELNFNQKKAVFSTEKKICVIAGPGCGKTKTLIARICRISQERPQSGILVLTFGKKAISEIKERSLKILGGNINKKLKISNIHSFCYEFLQKHYKILGFSSVNGSENFAICDNELQKSFIKEAIWRLEESNIDEKNISQIIKEISLNKLEVINDLSDSLRRVHEEYENILREQNYFDFSDLLIYTLILLNENENLRKKYQKEFEHVLVDEFQDINNIQWKIIKKISGIESIDHRSSLFVVGDPNQCIYGFQGSAPQIIESFLNRKEWTIYYLNVNYRSTEQIVGLSNHFLTKNKGCLVQNVLRSVKGKGSFVKYKESYFVQGIIDTVKELSYLYSIDQIAIIYRSNYLSVWFEKELIKKEIPYEILGAYKFLQRSEIKDIISYLRATINSDNSSFLRVFRLLEGIGKKTIEIIEDLSKFSNSKILDFMAIQVENFDLKRENVFNSKIKNLRKSKLIKNFVELFVRAKETFKGKGELHLSIERLLESFGYLEYILNKFGEERLMNIKQFLNMAKKWDEENYIAVAEFSLKEKAELFLNYLFLSFTDEEDLSQIKKIKKLTISNVHQVKGLEFKVVIFAYLDKGIIPSSISLNKDEEKRIFYVGITRAKEILYLVSTGNRSPFLDKIENLSYIEML